MDTRTKEAVRYLGYGRHAVDEATMNLISQSFQELEKVANARIVYRIFLVYALADDRIEIDGMEIKSKSLGKNMRGCREAVMLGATLGAGVDILMRRASLTDMAKAVVLQACAAAMLEEYLDEKQEEIAKELAKEGKYLRPRFSPGYGDFSIDHQGQILAMLDAPKKIGLTMTGGNMLTPIKSVTAVIAVSTHKEPCHRKGCEECEKRDCLYRRNEG